MSKLIPSYEEQAARIKVLEKALVALDKDYEKLLKDLQSAGNAGEFYTPRAVTQFIVEQVNPRLGETILDPACGTGGFLVCAIEHLRK